MLIALTGAQSTGKTTILRALKERKEFKNFEFITETTRKALGAGMKINEEGNDETQIFIINEHIKITNKTNNVITDRCILDVLIYTMYLYDNGNVSENTFKYATEVFKNTINKYDKIFYIKPEIKLTDDGIRSTNEDFRKDVAELFEWAIKFYNISVINLTGSVEERLNQMVKEAI